MNSIKLQGPFSAWHAITKLHVTFHASMSQARAHALALSSSPHIHHVEYGYLQPAIAPCQTPTDAAPPQPQGGPDTQ